MDKKKLLLLLGALVIAVGTAFAARACSWALRRPRR
jgi:hypothetical protein